MKNTPFFSPIFTSSHSRTGQRFDFSSCLGPLLSLRPTPSHPAHSFLPGPLLPTRPAPFPPAHSFPPSPSCQTVRERDKTSIYILTGNSCTKKGGVCIKGRYKPCPNGFEAYGRCGKGKKNKNKRCCCLLYLTPTTEPNA